MISIARKARNLGFFVVSLRKTTIVIKTGLILFATWVSLINFSNDYWPMIFASSSGGLILIALLELYRFFKAKRKANEEDSLITGIMALSLTCNAVAMVITGATYKNWNYILAGLGLGLWVTLTVFHLKQND